MDTFEEIFFSAVRQARREIYWKKEYLNPQHHKISNQREYTRGHGGKLEI